MYKKTRHYKACLTELNNERSGLTHLCRVDSSTITLWTGPFPIEGIFVIFTIAIFYRNSCLQKSVDPDQTPRSVASDLLLHCLPMSLL